MSLVLLGLFLEGNFNHSGHIITVGKQLVCEALL